MGLTRFGHVVFAVALAGLGVLSLVWGEFVYVWQPVPAWVPGRLVLGYASGALLVGFAAGLLGSRTLAPASLALGVYCVASIFLVHIPDVAHKPQEVGLWFGVGESAVILAGAWILFASAPAASVTGWRKALSGERGARLARVPFALSLLPFGLSHFAYADLTAGMVPSWLPGHYFWAYLTGAAHVAAGLAILIGVLPRLAATLEAVMVSLFAVTVNARDLLRTPRDHYAWTELVVACVIGGAAFLVAGSYRADPWLAWRRR
jgi:uncharacterized membrane protein YphA (DoxX/SURF4 family)